MSHVLLQVHIIPNTSNIFILVVFFFFFPNVARPSGMYIFTFDPSHNNFTFDPSTYPVLLQTCCLTLALLLLFLDYAEFSGPVIQLSF